MGLELKTIALNGSEQYAGKLHLDSQSLTFSSKEFKWSIALASRPSVKQSGTKLVIASGAETVSFEVGDEGPRWAHKILNPPNRMDKLGVKPNMRCWVSRGFSRVFLSEIRGAQANITKHLDRSELAFLKVTNRDELSPLLAACETLPQHVNLWVVWPKGSDAVHQGDVMSLTRDLGFGPSKTAAFDETHSSMRFARKR